MTPNVPFKNFAPTSGRQLTKLFYALFSKVLLSTSSGRQLT